MQAEIIDPRRYKEHLREYLEGLGIDVRRRFQCLSPDHEDRNPSMGYSPKGHFVHCFSCGVTYDIFDLVGMEYGLCGFRDQAEKVEELLGPISLPRLSYRREAGPADRTAELAALREQSDGSMEYFLSRGITEESCARHGLFQAEGRGVFPVYEDGVCRGWCSRSLDDSQPRYLNTAGPMGLWNGDVLVSGEGPVYVTEGIIDGLCLEQLGARAVALCGSQNTAKLLSRAAGLPNIKEMLFILCGDPDEAGRRMNQVLSEGLKALGARWSTLPLCGEDIGELYLRDTSVLMELMTQAERGREGIRSGSVAEQLPLFLARKDGINPIPTGFSQLDRLLDGGLYPGLYVIGAISSIGKTSFALQLADQVAAGGRDILFFSLEQSGDELLAKSLSRLSAQPDGRSGLTLRQILRGRYGGRARELEERYLPSASRMFITEGDGTIGSLEIGAAAREHQERHGAAPVVVVDYLQILAPSDHRATDKQNVDRAVVALRRLSRELDTPVIAISSFNRENYRSAVSMEAFKESGAVEYSADVLFGLQLSGAGGKGFDADKEKLRSPRRVELVMLKNRNGVACGKASFLYHAQYSLFREISPPRQEGT